VKKKKKPNPEGTRTNCCMYACVYIYICAHKPESRQKINEKPPTNPKSLRKLGPPAASAQGGLRYPAGVCRELAEWHPQGMPTSANPIRSNLGQPFRSATVWLKFKSILKRLGKFESIFKLLENCPNFENMF